MSKIRAKEKRKFWPQKRLSSGHRRTVFGTLKELHQKLLATCQGAASEFNGSLEL